MRVDKKTALLVLTTASAVAAFWQPWLLIISIVALLDWTKPTEDLTKIEEIEKRIDELNQKYANMHAAINVKRALGR